MCKMRVEFSLLVKFHFFSANKRKFEEETTEEFYTTSCEDILDNVSIADEIIQQHKRRKTKKSNYRNEK